MTGFSTRAIRASARAPRVDQHPTSVPIYQTATFASGDADELDAVLLGTQPGYAYSRVGNPTTAALAEAIAELEGAEAGYVLSSGMAAIHASLVSLVQAGDRIVAHERGVRIDPLAARQRARPARRPDRLRRRHGP